MSTVGRTPSAPPLDAELQRLLKRMRLPYIRNAAPELLATAKAQRWDPAEVLKALLVEEVSGRDRSALPAGPGPGSPPATPSPPGTPNCRPSRPPPSRRCAPWNGCTGGRT